MDNNKKIKIENYIYTHTYPIILRGLFGYMKDVVTCRLFTFTSFL